MGWPHYQNHLEIAALIVLIERPAVAPNSEQPDSTELRVGLLSLFVSAHGSSRGKDALFEDYECMHIVS
ncbi:uncharacterized protein N7484_005329 [Penicillium longicatenatum]|uniref:uncharacterized protein n=1 Tax=Penicillium longicatenatum TaxID=1561947 RepID=UPI0025469C86|nr:uncharacterized protein N7484_005329 [Penicillium longicatenatum]KAJ5651606.1 hypothetical protein N7484_005329 [Penicillium longicatenatum]